MKLPEEYLGFLLTNALNLSNEELKLLLNFTQGRLKTKDVKEWLRVHETEFESKASKIASQKASQVLHMDETDGLDYAPGDEDVPEEETEGLEVLLGALQELDGGPTADAGDDADAV